MNRRRPPMNLGRAGLPTYIAANIPSSPLVQHTPLVMRTSLWQPDIPVRAQRTLVDRSCFATQKTRIES